MLLLNRAVEEGGSRQMKGRVQNLEETKTKTKTTHLLRHFLVEAFTWATCGTLVENIGRR